MAEEIILVGNGSIRYARGLVGKSQKRDITMDEIWDAFTVAEQNALAGSGSNKVKAFLWTLAIGTTMRRQKVAAIVRRLEEGGFLETGRAQAIIDAVS